MEELGGDDILQWMKVKNVKTGEVRTVEADEEDGMFGVFDDSMPDGWGRLLTDRMLRQHGIDRIRSARWRVYRS